jgi:cholest-4-en-3-one 26-monooxygenase
MPTDTTDRRTLDLLDPNWYRTNPHDDYAWMRSHEPVYRDEANGVWGITRHADVLDIERRSQVFSSAGVYRAVPEPLEVNMIAQDDPRHQQQRRLLSNRFTPKAVKTNHDQYLRETITELIDSAAQVGTMEVVHDLAAQLPCRLTAKLLGYPEEKWADIQRWSERLMRIDMRYRDEQQAQEFFEANFEFATAFTEVFTQRKGCPMDDLASVWVNGEIDGEPLPMEAWYHETGLFISGGAETTRTVISHGLRTFCDNQDQWELLAAHPELVPSAVEELLRWVTPLNNFFRMATSDTTVGGQAIRTGERVILLYPSANRDASVFTDPMVFDVRRHPNPHLSFGNGTHFCVGANLARLELTMLFQMLTQRFTNLRVITEPDVEANIFARAVRSFDLAFDLR